MNRMRESVPQVDPICVLHGPFLSAALAASRLGGRRPALHKPQVGADGPPRLRRRPVPSRCWQRETGCTWGCPRSGASPGRRPPACARCPGAATFSPRRGVQVARRAVVAASTGRRGFLESRIRVDPPVAADRVEVGARQKWASSTTRGRGPRAHRMASAIGLSLARSASRRRRDRAGNRLGGGCGRTPASRSTRRRVRQTTGRRRPARTHSARASGNVDAALET